MIISPPARHDRIPGWSPVSRPATCRPRAGFSGTQRTRGPGRNSRADGAARVLNALFPSVSTDADRETPRASTVSPWEVQVSDCSAIRSAPRHRASAHVGGDALMNSAQSHPDDVELLQRVREGDDDAWAELWVRHQRSGLATARAQPGSMDAEDIVAEAFVRIFDLLRRGAGGPRDSFRPYLFATIRNIARSSQRDRSATFTAMDIDPDVYEADRDSTRVDRGVAEQIDSGMLAAALRELPERWREVLWCLDAQSMSTSEVAARFGLSSNSVAALSYRARRGLRASWIQQHVDVDASDQACREILSSLGQYEARVATARIHERVEAHLDACTPCRLLLDDVRHLSAAPALASAA